MNRAELHHGDDCSCRGTLRHLHPFEPDADGDCRRCEFGEDEAEVHVPAGETIIGYLDPSGKGEGNWAETEDEVDRLTLAQAAERYEGQDWRAISEPFESEWARLRADGFSESELRERSGAQ